MPLRITLCALAALILAGCSQQELVEKLASDEDKKSASACLDRLHAGDIEALEKQLDPSIKAADTHDLLVQVAAILPDGKPDSRELVGVHTNRNNGVSTVKLTYQYRFADQYFLVDCSHKKDGANTTIIGINIQAMTKPVEEMRQFDLTGKSARHYAVLSAAILFVLLSLAALLVCIRERGLERKWLWILCILFGITDLSVNWNTGATTFSPLSLQLFSAGTSTGPDGALLVSLALPLGAVLYLWRRFLNHRPAGRSNPV